MFNRVITFHYSVKNSTGEIIDSSRDGTPFSYIEGLDQVVPGLESRMKSLNVGDKVTLTIPAAEAYGEYHDEYIKVIPRADFPKREVKVGDEFEVGEEPEIMIVSVTAVTDTHVTLDGNHPLAGQDLTFDVDVITIRDATEEEMEHGHVHDGHIIH
jgi:FKBP-type peptidyl-prolyl cis-trans isomerase SlyD